eukprot:CAMPEP_0205929588 /NCGR_PEP_ID=MMETSP1325-20131115/25393_1 /ASSEMBLY_ACC=CAM_ASM_000708 /TAXON_ID=236786 /ORGANISM="Florenciella sp., Strain RCC1007" /LENGTH=166 /DNA_ID=CAMNT_0053298821 /DNA_START=167 /DNA_END=664 /DNA_ORIENTATION=-
MANPGLKRLRRELSALRTSDDEEIQLTAEEDNIRMWTAWIAGPPSTPYEGRFFRMRVEVGQDYPISPPRITFETKVFHPNINFDTGEICLDILKKNWTPAWSLSSACRAIIALLAEPDVDSPWNCDAGNMIRAGDTLAFESTARLYSTEFGATRMPGDADGGDAGV